MQTGNKGSALLTVLWLSAALSAVGLAVANNVRGETERTATGVDDAKAYFLARGAIERAALHMLWRNYSDPAGQPIYYRFAQPIMELDFPGGTTTVEIIPETAKLNPNSVRPEDLLRLLGALSVPPDRATEITAAILDWRTPVDPLHPSLFDDFYLSQTPSFLPPHASYRENEELLLTRGITPGLYYGESLDHSRAGLRDCLSIFGSDFSVDANTAEEATLEAVGLSADDARTLVKQRAIRPIVDYTELGEIQKELGPSGQRLTLGGHSMFTLRATARLRQPDGTLSDMRRTIAALVQINLPGNARGKETGYQVIRWFDRT
jgi:general secretion pathway protein K